MGWETAFCSNSFVAVSCDAHSRPMQGDIVLYELMSWEAAF